MAERANDPIMLIVGLGNPGAEYADTRHNVGFWFVDELARRAGESFRMQSKFSGELADLSIDGARVRLLKPTTYMNLSGQAVVATANFYRISPSQILVAHDEIDLPIGEARLKRGGGHGGHNGLRDIISKLGQNGFARLRLGVGHPGTKARVTGHVLGRASAEDRALIDESCERVIKDIGLILRGDIDAVMNRLHRKPKKKED
ncbi:MAG: aminoacyl-tRNA hydrolase [Gammaproteobacteria bacterium]|nr:aminoacyl-tRNA hydrolase [Gammaproteobacteria bacterium]